MTLPSKNNGFTIASSGIVHILFLVGLLVMAYSLVTQNWLIFVCVLALPLTIITLLFAIEKPMLSYMLYVIVVCYFSAIYRYSGIEGLSGILDILLAFCLFSIFINVISNKSSYQWQLGMNVLTLSYLLWLSYCILILLSPHATLNNLLSHRGVFIGLPLSYFISCILLCSTKKLRITLLLLCCFIVTVSFKLYWQRVRGWDSTEAAWLMEGAWQTHLLSTGVRYFSFYSDAGNFGSSMGMFTIALGIIGVIAKKKLIRYSCIASAGLAAVGLLMSGTRGAIIVPMGGLLLYLLLSKNLKNIISSVIICGLTFCFFYFTDIGDDNSFIRRMRTAFRPTEDASFNVRIENQKRFATYLADKPFGLGVGGVIMDPNNDGINEERTLPTDSFYVGIWVEGGIVGLYLYIGIQVLVLLRCCYLIMFRIRNDQLRKILAALLCGVFGIWLNGYVGRGMGANPSGLIIAIFLAFVLNGVYMDKELKKDEIII